MAYQCIPPVSSENAKFLGETSRQSDFPDYGPLISLVMVCVGNDAETDTKKRKLAVILNQLRIEAEIVAIDWSNIIDSRYPPELRANYLHMDTPMLPDEYVKGMLNISGI